LCGQAGRARRPVVGSIETVTVGIARTGCAAAVVVADSAAPFECC
jgi:hypothetical protein